MAKNGTRLKTAENSGATYKGSAQSTRYNTVRAVDKSKATEQERRKVTEDSRVAETALRREVQNEERNLRLKQGVEAKSLEMQAENARTDLERTQFTEKSNLELEDDYKLSQAKIKGQEGVFNSQLSGSNIDMFGTLVKGVADLSSSYFSYQEDQQKIAEQQQAIDDATGFLLGSSSGITAVATSATQQADSQRTADVAGETAIRAGAENPVDQDALRQPGRDRRNEENTRAISTLAFSSGLSANLESWFNSDTEIIFPDGRPGKPSDARTLAELNAVLQFGVGQLIRQNGGVDGLSAAQLTTLSQSAISAINSIQSTRGPGMISGQQDEEIRGAQDVFITSWNQGGNLGDQVRALADQYYTSGRYNSRDEANRAALNFVIEFAQNMPNGNGNSDLLEDLRGVHIRVDANGNGIPGSEAWTYVGDAIDTAIQDGFSEDRQAIEREATEIVDTLFTQLNDDVPETREQRQEMITQAIQQLRDAGAYDKAKTLADQFQGLSADPNNAVTYSDILDAIDRGDTTITPNYIEEQVALGLITREQGDAAITRVNEANKPLLPNDQEAKDLATSTVRGLMADAERTLGVKVGQDGTKAFGGGDIPAAHVENYEAAVRQDLNRVLNEALARAEALGYAEGSTERTTLIRQAVQGWRETNFTEGGKFYLAPQSADNQVSDGAKATLKELYEDPTVAATPQLAPAAGTGRDLTDSVEVDGILSPQVRAQFNPLRGDRIFTPQIAQQFADEYATGVVPEGLQRSADAIGMTPYQLLVQQMGANGLTTRRPEKIQPVRSIPNRNSRGYTPQTDAANAGENFDFKTSVEAAEYLMAQGLPVRGASWLAGNLETESGFNGMRSWDDVGLPAGGLASWRAERLTALEQEYGKPITQIPERAQLEYLVRDMQENYPAVWRVFNDPRATDRQLLDASYDYWRWGEEGDRELNAQNTVRQIESRQNNRQTKNTSSSVTTSASAVRGMDTSSGPDAGVNACLWAVNKVLERAGIEPPWGNSVYVPRAKEVLDQVGVRLSGPEPGAIVINQDYGDPPYPHVGIVQEDGSIISNSSSRASFDRVESPEAYEASYGRPNLYYRLPS